MLGSMNRDLFEQRIIAETNTKYYSAEFAVRQDKYGNYIKYETRIAWEWWCKATKLLKY